MDDAIFTSEAGLSRLATEWLPTWLQGRRWFGGKNRVIQECRVRHYTRLGPAWICAVEVHFAESSPETYFVPLMQVPSAEASAVVAAMNGNVLADATHVPEFRAALYRALTGLEMVPDVITEQGSRTFSPIETQSRLLSIEQSNTSLVYGDRMFVKWFRKLEPGVNPDVEILRFLGDRARFFESPGFLGSLTWLGGSLAVAMEYFPDAVDCWKVATQFYQRCDESGVAEEWRGLARKLGEATGRMHMALASEPEDAAFAPEPITRDDVEGIARSMLLTARDAISELAEADGKLPESLLGELFVALDGMRPIQRLVEQIQNQKPEGVKIRTHGDYHLGQVLRVGEEFKITDFEGEPLRPLSERRRKLPAVRDVAGMLRSLAYAADSQGGAAGIDISANDQVAFLEGWRSSVAGSALGSETLLPIFLLEKAFYELRYELRHRPDWVHIPMADLIGLCREI